MSLRYLIDTNICIYLAKRQPLAVVSKFEQLVVGEVGISVITYGELLYGAQKSNYKKRSLAILEELISLIIPLPLPTSVGKHYGEVRSQLERAGTPIGNNDLWIAAHALALEVTLVTNNIKEFSRIKQLKLENWVE